MRLRRPVIGFLIGLLVPLALLNLGIGPASGQVPPLPPVGGEDPCPDDTPTDALRASRVRTEGVRRNAAAATSATAIAYEGENCADLSMTVSDSHDPVRYNDYVQYTVNVSNAGPDAAPYTYASIGSSGQIQAYRGNGWTCGTDGPYYLYCERATLASGATAPPIFVLVRALSEGSDMMLDAWVGFWGDEPDHGNNEWYEDTTLSSSAGRSAAAVIPPGGGSVSTCPGSGTTTPDNTCGRMTFPPGPGGIALVVEHPAGLTPCAVLACAGSAVDYVLPPGYKGAAGGVQAFLQHDVSTAPAGDQWLAFVEKPFPPLPVPVFLPVVNCPSNAPLKGPLPCQAGRYRTGAGDLEFKFLLESQDPKFQGIAPLKLGQ